MRRLLIANRGEVAVRIARSAAELGIETVAVHSADDAGAPSLRAADAVAALPGSGTAAYLDVAAIVATARAQGCDAIHPGWGFLSESAALAEACTSAAITFVGAPAALLELFGDKARARALAQDCDVPVAEGAASLAAAHRLLAGGAVMVKAVSGGGGRGMRPAADAPALDAAWRDCAAEALAAFGNDALYAERLIERAQHIEVQIIGDGTACVALGARECSLQRRRQKLIEVAPVADTQALEAAALGMATRVGYRGLGTWEFLVGDGRFLFMEVNPRLQVEHTVTEETTGIDLVAVQLRLAQDATLAELGLLSPPPARGFALELRVNAEVMDAQGDVRPAGGVLSVFEPPSGLGVRVDHAAGVGHAPNPRFDSLLAKLIVHAPDRRAAFRRARRALAGFRIEGVATNIPILAALLEMPAVQAGRVHTRLVEDHAPALAALQPLAAAEAAPEGLVAARAPMVGLLVSVDVAPGDLVGAGQRLALIEAMKMQMPVTAAVAGRVREVAAAPGVTLREGQVVALIEPAEADGLVAAEVAADPDAIRADLAEALARRAATLDAARPDAVARRHTRGKQTARENLDALFDPDSFIEYGALTVAAQRRRRSMEELIRLSPADGVVAGIGTIDGASCAALAYDYTAMAGTQGFMGHKKTDRLLHVTQDLKLPFVLFAEGGGGRPGETDVMGVAGLDLTTFARFAGLSGSVPVVGIVAGNCFAGNAAVLGCCDTIIATEDSSIGMGGPAMIEGGGLGVFTPDQVGPVSVQNPNGVIDVLVANEAAAVATARRYLGYFRGRSAPAGCADQRLLRHAVPEDRKRAYDMRALLDLLADTGSVLELRRGFAPGIITALIRIEGHPLGLIANNPMHLGGAIDAVGADKAARFLQLCEAHGLPVLSLCDTPGFMVGPETERTAQVRHVCRMFVVGAAMTVPHFCIVTRKGYGLGAMAMAAGGFHETVFTAAWPSGEFGGMGLEGAVRLGYRRELEAEVDPAARQALFEQLVGRLYAEGKAINMASYLEIDAVIDPRETRDWVLRGLAAAPARRARAPKRFIDTW
jgi:acetyl-CoA carboxylase carboxyltransferase component/acetyl/propionyl-CoA carboxylase alpha subunit